MSARQNKKRKGRNHVNNRERTVTTFTEDPNTSFLVPLSSEDPPAILSSPFSASSFSMSYQNYIAPQQQQFYQPVLPPGKNDLEILENLKTIIKEGQHEFYRAVPQPAALASLYMGHISQPQDQPPTHDTSIDDINGLDTASLSVNNVVEPRTPLSIADTSPVKLAVDLPVPDANLPSVQLDPEDIARGASVDHKTDAAGEYGIRPPVDTPSPNKASSMDVTKDEPPHLTGDDTWDRRTIDDRNTRYEDNNGNLPPTRATSYDSRPLNGTTTTEARISPPEDNRLHDRDRDRDRDRFIDRERDRDWERDRDRHDANRDRGRDRRSEFFGRSYGRSHAPRPPPELRHYEPSYGDDYVPPRRHDPDDRRGGPRSAPSDDRSKPPPPFDDRRPHLDDRRPPPSPADERRPPLDDRPIRPLPASDTRPLPPSSEERGRSAGEAMSSVRPTAEDDRGLRANSLATDDRPRVTVPLEERLSAPAPSLQDRLSQPAPARVDPPSLEERLSLGPVPPRAYTRAPSVVRDDLRAPLPKDDPRDHDRISDYRTNRDFSRERPGGLLTAASTYRPDLDRAFGDRDERDRRDRDVAGLDVPPARFGDTFSRIGPPPQRRYTPPPPVFDRDRERERGRSYYPTRSPPPFRAEGAYYPDGERRYGNDRERDAYEQRRREWYTPGDDDKRGPPPPPPPPTSWRPHERPPFVDRDRERPDRERERERDVRERDRERDRDRDRDLGGLPPPPPPPTRGQWDDRDRRFPPSLPPSRMETTGGRSLSARLTDPYPPPPSSPPYGAPPPPRNFDRGRYDAPVLDDHTHGHAHAHGHVPPLPFSRVRARSPTPPRRGPGPVDDMRPPMKRAREDSGPGAGYANVSGVGSAYSPPRRGEYVPGPPPPSGMGSVSGTVPARSAGTRTPPVSAAPPPTTGASSVFYDRGGIGERERERERAREREREREREQREREKGREYVRGEYGMGYDRDGRGRRSPPLVGSRMGPSGGGAYGRGVVGDRRDDRRYVPPPPRTT